MPDKIMQPAAGPVLDAQCRFPWYGVRGCKGRDVRAMLRLTVSDDIEQRSRLNAAAGWYENVRKEYGGK